MPGDAVGDDDDAEVPDMEGQSVCFLCRQRLEGEGAALARLQEATLPQLTELRRGPQETATFCGQAYHAGCVNLWLHRVNKEPPQPATSSALDALSF